MKHIARVLSLLLAVLFLFGSVALAGNEIRISAADYPVEENGRYSDMEHVAVYLTKYRRLPSNYLTKNKAQDLGWTSSKGNLWQVTDHGSIGGDRFGNYEGLLPQNQWTECDIDFDGGYRNGKRIVFSKDVSLIYYTDDHYSSFRQVIVDTTAPAATAPAAAATEEPFVFTPVEVEEWGEYTTVNEVASYLHTFGMLPCNYITKDEAKELGWSQKKDNLNEVMPGCTIGGDNFQNREKLLPEAEERIYYECDVNGTDGCRTEERIVFSNDGLIYYSPDSFATFIQLY